jgi:hypothetical protein
MSIPAEHLAAVQHIRGQEADAAPEPVVEETRDEVADLKASLARLEESNTQLKARVEQSERVATAAASRQDVAPAEPQPEPEWEKMTTKQIVEVVIEAMQDEVGKVRRELGTAIIADRLERQIEKAMDKYPDFMEYSQDVVDITKEKNGNITPVEAYKLAKDRRAETNPKSAEPVKSAPSSGARPSTTGARKAEVKPTTARESALKAYQKTFGGKN